MISNFEEGIFQAKLLENSMISYLTYFLVKQENKKYDFKHLVYGYVYDGETYAETRITSIQLDDDNNIRITFENIEKIYPIISIAVLTLQTLYHIYEYLRIF